jgi:hypothetical protein
MEHTGKKIKQILESKRKLPATFWVKVLEDLWLKHKRGRASSTLPGKPSLSSYPGAEGLTDYVSLLARSWNISEQKVKAFLVHFDLYKKVMGDKFSKDDVDRAKLRVTRMGEF